MCKSYINDEALVVQYINDLQLPCTSLNFKSCHMINWSPYQRCFWNGNACINLNDSPIANLTILTEKDARLNKFACLAIEAKITAINEQKYFTYDQYNKCKIFSFEKEEQVEKFQSCEKAIGNKNVCTGLTVNNYCMWDIDELKCVQVTNEELGEFTTCSSNLNSNACIENVLVSDSRRNALPCFFSNEEDLCQEAPLQVECEFFNGKGKIIVCERINLERQMCEYSKETCIKSETLFDNCDVSKTNANNRVCYKSTNGDCRWDSSAFKCYENQTEISELNCSDNLNKILCQKVERQSCMWDDIKYQCQEFFQKTSEQFEILNKDVNHLYNEKACLLITGAGYYYDKSQKKCIKIDESINTLRCDQYQMNQYACLYQTRTNLCFYDQNDQYPNQLCKVFEDEQSKCNTSNLINIEVCMGLQYLKV